MESKSTCAAVRDLPYITKKTAIHVLTFVSCVMVRKHRINSIKKNYAQNYKKKMLINILVC